MRLPELLQVLLISTYIVIATSGTFIDRLLADFDWGLAKEDGYPEIHFNDSTTDSEVVFKYNFTGNLSESKFLKIKLLTKDCIQNADNNSLAFRMNTTDHELLVDVDINQETISTSKHYNESADGLSAKIDFCVRVDYMYINPDNDAESINFLETAVVIDVDLTANFTLASVNVSREGASQDNSTAGLDYAVDAYFCLDDNEEVGAPVLAQGDALQFCVKISDQVTTENVFVEDILEFELTQDGGTTVASKPIINTSPDPLTSKVCREAGICNVKTQLTAKWFSETFPKPLQIGGIAILSFGKASMMPSAAPGPVTGRRLRAPVRGLINEDQLRLLQRRHLQETTAPVSGAGQTTPPTAQNGATTSPTGNGSQTTAAGATTVPNASGQTTAPAAAGATTTPNATGQTTAPATVGATTAPVAEGQTTAPVAAGNATTAPVAAGNATTAPLFDDAAYDDYASTGGTPAPSETVPPGFLGGASAAFGDLQASLTNNVNKTVTKYCEDCNVPDPGILAAIIICVVLSIILTLLFCLCPSKTVKKTIEEKTIMHEHEHNQNFAPIQPFHQPQPIVIPTMFQSHPTPQPLPPPPPPPPQQPLPVPPPPFYPQSPHQTIEPSHFTFNMINPTPLDSPTRASVYSRRRSVGSVHEASVYSRRRSIGAASLHGSLHGSIHDLWADEGAGVLGLPDIID